MRILIAGIGNVLRGDDGFGVAVVRRLAGRELPAGVVARDFGIRGMDLAFALQEAYDGVVLVDATPRGGVPGTLYLIEPEIAAEGAVALDAHGMDPVQVLRLARTLGAPPTRVLLVGCEPEAVVNVEADEELRMALSPPVAAAVEEAVSLVMEAVRRLHYERCRSKGGDGR